MTKVCGNCGRLVEEFLGETRSVVDGKLHHDKTRYLCPPKQPAWTPPAPLDIDQ